MQPIDAIRDLSRPAPLWRLVCVHTRVRACMYVHSHFRAGRETESLLIWKMLRSVTGTRMKEDVHTVPWGIF